MAFGKLQSGHWIVAGRCSEPRFSYVGENNTPRCTIGIAAGKSKEKDENGYFKTIWINVTAWRDLASILYQARKGDSVLVTGLLNEREWEGKTYKDIQAEFVSVSKKVEPFAYSAPPDASVTSGSPPDFTEMADDEDDGKLPF